MNLSRLTGLTRLSSAQVLMDVLKGEEGNCNGGHNHCDKKSVFSFFFPRYWGLLDSVLICNVNFCFKNIFLQILPSLLLDLFCNSIMLINSPLTNSLEIDMTLIYQSQQRGTL